jgi:hypothetical protein
MVEGPLKGVKLGRGVQPVGRWPGYWGVQEAVSLDHGGGHVVGPFKHLWLNVVQKGVGCPAAQYHNAVA